MGVVVNCFIFVHFELQRMFFLGCSSVFVLVVASTMFETVFGVLFVGAKVTP